jgi:hypothetical protein
MLTRQKVNFLSIALISTLLLNTINVFAYHCKFINKSHAEASVTFFRMKTDMKGHASKEHIVQPQAEARWGAGKWGLIPYSIFGMRINKITYQGKVVPGTENFKKEMWSTARPSSFNWILEEQLVPDSTGKATQLKFILFRTPSGFKGSTYPGGPIAEFGPVAIK